METFNVVTLGPSGSGKTVFLAALQERLRTQGQDLGFYVRLPRAQERKLSQIYAQVEGDGDWPPPTQRSETPEWTFQLCVRSPHGIFETMRVRYIDYAGEHLTDPQDDSVAAEWLEGQVDQADAVLGLLDGMRILDLMHHKAGADMFFREELGPVFRYMQHTDKPIHFVITKWDLVENSFSLVQVRERLMEEKDFKNIIESRGPAKVRGYRIPPGRVRLIPVSAVGSRFATLDKKGQIHKRANAKPEPFNVEIPLVAVLPDLCVRAYYGMLNGAEVRRGDEGEEFLDESSVSTHGSRHGRLRMLIAQGVAAPLGGALGAVGISVNPIFFQAVVGAVMEVLPAMGGKSPARRERAARKIQKGWWHKKLARVRTRKDAVRYTMHRLVDRLLDFEETANVNQQGSTLA